jgi:hypothetical protein
MFFALAMHGGFWCYLSPLIKDHRKLLNTGTIYLSDTISDTGQN